MRVREERWRSRRCCLHPVACAVTVARPLMLFSLLTGGGRERERERETRQGKERGREGEGGGEEEEGEKVGGYDIQIRVKRNSRQR